MTQANLLLYTEKAYINTSVLLDEDFSVGKSNSAFANLMILLTQF